MLSASEVLIFLLKSCSIQKINTDKIMQITAFEILQSSNINSKP